MCKVIPYIDVIKYMSIIGTSEILCTIERSLESNTFVTPTVLSSLAELDPLLLTIGDGKVIDLSFLTRQQLGTFVCLK